MVPREQESDLSGESVVTCWQRSSGVESEDRGCIGNSQKRVDAREEEITLFTQMIQEISKDPVKEIAGTVF